MLIVATGTAIPAGLVRVLRSRTGVAASRSGPRRQGGLSLALPLAPWHGHQFPTVCLQPAGPSQPYSPARCYRDALGKRDQLRWRDVSPLREWREAVDYHQTNDVWHAFEYDLTAQRGSNLTLRFEVDPGPNNNASFDYSFWGDRQLVPRIHATDRRASAPPPLALTNLWAGQNDGVAPPSGSPGPPPRACLTHRSFPLQRSRRRPRVPVDAATVGH